MNSVDPVADWSCNNGVKIVAEIIGIFVAARIGSELFGKTVFHGAQAYSYVAQSIARRVAHFRFGYYVAGNVVFERLVRKYAERDIFYAVNIARVFFQRRFCDARAAQHGRDVEQRFHGQHRARAYFFRDLVGIREILYARVSVIREQLQRLGSEAQAAFHFVGVARRAQ